MTKGRKLRAPHRLEGYGGIIPDIREELIVREESARLAILQNIPDVSFPPGGLSERMVNLADIGSEANESEQEMAGMEIFNLQPLQVCDMLAFEEHMPAG